ncbi:MAG: VWA domain-containing protein, partial [Anaerolineae bacterium]
MTARKLYALSMVMAIAVLMGVLGIALAPGAPGVEARVPDAAVPHQADEPEASTCTIDLSKWVDPDHVILGGTTDVTLVVSGTCPAKPLPVDLVILADESTSMTRAQNPGGDPFPTMPPEPTGTPDLETPPVVTPPTGGERTPDPREGEPPFCHPSGNFEATPSPTPTRRWPPWRTPTPEPPSGPKPTPIGEYAGSSDQIREIQSWVSDFLGRPEIERDFASGRLRMGFVAFSDRARIRQELSDDPGDIESAARRMRGSGVTRINLGTREVERILMGDGARLEQGDEGRIKVVIILSDFEFCQRDMQRFDRDVYVFTAGFDVRDYDRPKMFDMATGREYVSERHQVRDTIQYYEPLAVGGMPVAIDQMTVQDRLDDRMSLLPDTVDPPTVTITGQLLEWQFDAPTLPMTLGYTVEPLMGGGLISVSQQAGAVWVDSEAGAGSGDFPDVAVWVDIHTETPTPTATDTPTPTPTDTPTATPTATPADLYLPITFKIWPEVLPTPTICVPELQKMDVALVIDTSTSMSNSTQEGGKPKIDAAIEAAQELVSMLKPADQTAVIGFNVDATVVQTLTTDKALVASGLQSLTATQAQGTSIDAGLRAGLEELSSERRQVGSHRVIVLVTDGVQTGPGGEEAVRQAAQEIH